MVDAAGHCGELKIGAELFSRGPQTVDEGEYHLKYSI